MNEKQTAQLKEYQRAINGYKIEGMSLEELRELQITLNLFSIEVSQATKGAKK